MEKIVVLLEGGLIPIFVFDGKMPEIKIKEVRRRISEKNDFSKNAKVMAKNFLNALMDNRNIKSEN